MKNLFENIPKIIEAASKSPLSLLALLVVALSIIAFFFFRKSSLYVRVIIFFLMFSGTISFVVFLSGSFSDKKKAKENDMINEIVSIKEYRSKDYLAKIVASAKGSGANKDIVVARIMAEKDAIKKVKKRLISRLSESPYNLTEKDAIVIFNEGEIIDLEYLDNGQETNALLKYEIKIPRF